MGTNTMGVVKENVYKYNRDDLKLVKIQQGWFEPNGYKCDRDVVNTMGKNQIGMI